MLLFFKMLCFLGLLPCYSCAKNLGAASLGMNLPPPMFPEADDRGQFREKTLEGTALGGIVYHPDDASFGGGLRFSQTNGGANFARRTDNRPSRLYGFVNTFGFFNVGRYRLRNPRYRTHHGNYSYVDLGGGVGGGLVLRLHQRWWVQFGWMGALGFEGGSWGALADITRESAAGVVVADPRRVGSGSFTDDLAAHSLLGFHVFARTQIRLTERSRINLGGGYQMGRRHEGSVPLVEFNAGLENGPWELLARRVVTLPSSARRSLVSGWTLGVRRRLIPQEHPESLPEPDPDWHRF